MWGMKKTIIFFIKLYQRIPHFYPSVCRFYPSCSQYAKESIEKYGVRKGILLGIKRIVKCHPFHPGGHDPV